MIRHLISRTIASFLSLVQWTSLRTKLILRFSLSIIPIFLIFEFFTFGNIESNLKKHSASHLVEAARAQASEITHWLKELSAHLETASQAAPVQQGITNEVYWFLKSLSERVPAEIQCIHYSNIFTGQIETSSCEPRIGQNVRHENLEWFREGARGKRFISRPFPGRLNNKPLIVLTEPVYHGGIQTHILSFHVSLEAKTSGMYAHTKNGFTMMTDQDGTILTYPDRENILKVNAFRDKFRPELHSALKQAISRKAGFQESVSSGRQLFVAWNFSAISPDRTWAILVVTPVSEDLAHLYLLRRGMIWIFGIIALMTVVVAFYSLGSLSRDVEKIAKLMEETGHEHLDVPFFNSGIREVNRISSAFSKMWNNLEIYLVAFKYSGDAIVVMDRNWNVLIVNDAFTKITRYPAKDVIGKPGHSFLGNQVPESSIDGMQKNFDEMGMVRREQWNYRADSTEYFQDLTITHVKLKNEIENYIAIFADHTERKLASEKMSFLSHHDSLTGLPNRDYFQEQLEHVILKARRKAGQASILYVDIDNFKIINESLGHGRGDRILVEFAARMQEVLRAEDTFARLGGDEFGIILEDISGVEEVVGVAQRVLDMMKTPFEINYNKYYVTVSIGITVFPENAESPGDLVKTADSAMYQAKLRGKNQFCFFTDDMNLQARKRLMYENQLREAIDDEEFVMFYQPIADSHTGKYVGMEALVRWKHSGKIIIGPDQFLGILEETGLIRDVGRIIIRQAIADLARLHEINPELYMSINLSPVQLMDSELIDLVLNLVKQHKINASKLVVEVTENTLMEKISVYQETLGRINSAGIRIAIDDFGTGYSSMSYLQKLPVQIIKIDKSFISQMVTDSNAIKIIKAIAALAQSMSLVIIVEGVESQQQKEMLEEINLTTMQGYLFKKPCSFDEILSQTREIMA